MAAAAAAAGCGYSSHYPDYPDWLLDSGDAGVPAAPVATVPCSGAYGQPLALTVVSVVQETLWLAVVDPATCDEQPYAELYAGQQLYVDTTDNLAWTARDGGGQLLDAFVAPAGASQWTEYVP